MQIFHQTAAAQKFKIFYIYKNSIGAARKLSLKITAYICNICLASPLNYNATTIYHIVAALKVRAV